MSGYTTPEMREFTAETLNRGIIIGDPWTYVDGTTAERLRSGVDGPHSRLADRLCGLSGRQTH